MNLLDFLGDIVIFGFSDLIDNKKVSHKTRKRLLITFIIVSLCYVGSFLFCILWGIKQDNIILSVLGIVFSMVKVGMMLSTMVISVVGSLINVVITYLVVKNKVAGQTEKIDRKYIFISTAVVILTYMTGFALNFIM